MTASVLLEALREQRVVPVIRSADADDAIATATACAEAGMEIVELTHSTPGVERAVAALAAAGLTVGVGTITDPSQVDAAAAAGAGFVVSFTTPDGFVAAAHTAGIAALPGALTPTEVFGAVAQGADAIKVFPARAVSPAHLADLRAVLPNVSFLATGGLAVADGSAQAWLDAGALAVGLGGILGTVAGDGAELVRARVREALQQTGGRSR